jgi:cysteine desulfurase
MIYLDNNATTKVAQEVIAAMLSYWSEMYFNPASAAGEMAGADKPIRLAKTNLAATLGASPEEFFITSGATEANNWALQKGVKRAIKIRGKCCAVISAIEHPSVLETALQLREENREVRLDVIPVNNDGAVSLEKLNEILTPETDFVSIMLANNETGVIQPIREATKLAKVRNPRCIFHTDATQAVGKIEVDLDGNLNQIDLLSLSAHKFHGPKGIGALFIRAGLDLPPLLYGGSQQNGLHAGTENPPLAAGLAKALELLGGIEGIKNRGQRIKELRDALETEIQARNPKIKFLGGKTPRLPNTSLLLLPDIEGEMVVHQLWAVGIMTSTGSACSSGSDTPSHVVTAMGVNYSEARNVLRVSLSALTTREEIERLVVAASETLNGID